MNFLDLFILGILLVSAILSFWRGFIREVLSLAAWVVAAWVAIQFSGPLSNQLVNTITVPEIRYGASFVLLFVVTLLLAAIINKLAGQLVKKTGFSSTDRMIGVIFGLARGGVIIAIIVLLAGFTKIPHEPWWAESVFLDHFEQLAGWMRQSLPPDVAQQFAYQQ